MAASEHSDSEQVEDHQNWQKINPFTHYSVKDMPKRTFLKEEYGRAPSGSRSEQRALQAQVQSLQEILQLCELIHQKGEMAQESELISVHFGQLFELYNNISDKLMGTLLGARKHKYVDFPGETLFQGRDDRVLISLERPFDELKGEILLKIEDIRCIATEKPIERPALRNAQFS
ncbi:actin-binding Rho-activating protein isoform X2 [Drosophila willistoni]|uniref:actin-binding Rho-activating protein isoform X2 n=1 Tax=Drosophila willistoni TaxID=7260 RepID=UPI000C26C15E|nr:actin-binding Rho-activating protein isoform X2 [Drosophila willistoni]